MLFTLGRIMGWVILAFYLLASMNFVMKYANRKWVAKLPRESVFRKRYLKVLQFIIKAHPAFGYLAFFAVIIHMLIQFRFYGFWFSGFLAGGLMLIQIGIGSFGQWHKKKKRGPWLTVHRTVTVILLIVIALHVIPAVL